jgi:hypothetical protein
MKAIGIFICSSKLRTAAKNPVKATSALIKSGQTIWLIEWLLIG